MLTDMEYLTRPYEVVPVRRQSHEESADYLFEVFQKRDSRKKWGLLAWHFFQLFADALRL